MSGNTQGEILRELLAVYFDKSSSFVGMVIDVNEDLQHLFKMFPGLQIYCTDCGEQIYRNGIVQWVAQPPSRNAVGKSGVESDRYPKDFLDFVFIGADRQNQVAGRIRDYWSCVKVDSFIGGVSSPDILKAVSTRFKSGVITDVSGAWYRLKDKWIVVTGCMRSATLYITHILQRAGVQVRHQEYFTEGTVNSYAAPCEFPVGTILLQQARNPLHVIGSLQTCRKYSWAHISKFIPISLKENPLLRCMKHWYYWNLLLEPRASFRYRVEDLEDVWEDICTLIEVPLGKIPEVSKTTHTRIHRYSPVTWADLRSCNSDLCSKIIGMAERYGYVL